MMANGQKDLVLEELENGVMRLILNDEKRQMRSQKICLIL